MYVYGGWDGQKYINYGFLVNIRTLLTCVRLCVFLDFLLCDFMYVYVIANCQTMVEKSPPKVVRDFVGVCVSVAQIVHV